MSATYDVVVVGAGPAGLAAARRAVECGVRVALLDDNPRPGGQIWRAHGGRIAAEAARWISECERMESMRVVQAPEKGRLLLERWDGAAIEIRYSALVLATGARELILPFPGWTLPNVMGAGGLQALAKSGMPVAGKRIVVAGSGPLLMAVAKYLRTHGARVALIAEQASHPSVTRFAIALAGHPEKLAQAIALKAQLFGLRYLTSCWPLAAQGTGQLESVTLTRMGRTWNEPCDYLACGFGLVPNLELAQFLGCRIGGGAVRVDDTQQTSVSGVYAAGEITGIGGLDLALLEGEIAGFAAAGRPELARSRFVARASQQRFAEALNRAFALRPELRRLAQPETLVCRCEDVPLSRLQPCSSFREAKLHTRCGMGPCQGRVCGAATEFLFGWKNESVRPPVFPARIGTLTVDGE